MANSPSRMPKPFDPPLVLRRTKHRTPRWHACAAMVATLIVADGSMAIEDARPLAAARAASIESCVSTTPIRFQPEERRAALDAADAANVAAALTRRYPVLERDGLSPDGVLLWQKAGAGWLYVTLLANPDKPAEVCFTATFVASRFELTGALLVKYFGAGVAVGEAASSTRR